MNEVLLKNIKHVKRLIIAVFGFTVLLIGIVMIISPGPAIVVILAGLAVLATEFVWARNLLKKAKKMFEEKIKRQK